MVELGKKDKNIVVLCADISDSTRSGMFRDAFPERFIETGIAEQNMMGLAVGLALSGKIPFVSTYSARIVARSSNGDLHGVYFKGGTGDYWLCYAKSVDNGENL